MKWHGVRGYCWLQEHRYAQRRRLLFQGRLVVGFPVIRIWASTFNVFTR